MSLYCTSALYTFSYTVSTNHKSRVRGALRHYLMGASLAALDLLARQFGYVLVYVERQGSLPAAANTAGSCDWSLDTLHIGPL